MTTTNHHDADIAPELAALKLADKPDGPAAAAMVAAGIGIFVLGLLTSVAHGWSALSGFLADFQGSRGVGALAGKSTVSVMAFFISWGVLHMMWRDKEVNIKRMFNIGLVLGLLGALGTFPTFFELF